MTNWLARESGQSLALAEGVSTRTHANRSRFVSGQQKKA